MIRSPVGGEAPAPHGRRRRPWTLGAGMEMPGDRRPRESTGGGLMRQKTQALRNRNARHDIAGRASRGPAWIMVARAPRSARDRLATSAMQPSRSSRPAIAGSRRRRSWNAVPQQDRRSRGAHRRDMTASRRSRVASRIIGRQKLAAAAHRKTPSPGADRRPPARESSDEPESASWSQADSTSAPPPVQGRDGRRLAWIRRGRAGVVSTLMKPPRRSALSAASARIISPARAGRSSGGRSPG